MTNRAWLGGVTVGDGVPVAVAGALNVSPESFYRGAVVTGRDHLLRAADAMARAGAAFVDVGAMSTAPYGAEPIPESQETDRLGQAVELLVKELDLPVSADTSRAAAAQAALDAGARIINDVTGLTGDPALAPLVARAGAGIILMACPRSGPTGGEATEVIRGLLEESLGIARAAGVDPSRIAVDPGIGFFRTQGMAWHEWDCAVLAGLHRLRALGRPVCVGVSRKSFIGAAAGEDDPARRLPGSLAATALAVAEGAQLIRTHDVEETVQAVRVAEAVCRAAGRT